MCTSCCASGRRCSNEAAPASSPQWTLPSEFWRSTWARCAWTSATCRSYGLDEYRLTPTLSGEILRPAARVRGDLRMHFNNGALRSFSDSLALMHPFGKWSATTCS